MWISAFTPELRLAKYMTHNNSNVWHIICQQPCELEWWFHGTTVVTSFSSTCLRRWYTDIRVILQPEWRTPEASLCLRMRFRRVCKVNRLQLNPTKTLSWYTPVRRRHQIPTGPVHIADTAVMPVSVDGDRGVYIDTSVTVSAYATAAARACNVMPCSHCVTVTAPLLVVVQVNYSSLFVSVGCTGNSQS